MPDRRISGVACPQCTKPFRLRWDDYSTLHPERGNQTLFIRSCPSGGIYDVRIECPHCDYVEEV
jgi:hypothetical protein